MGELRLRHSVRVFDAPLRPHEAVRDAGGADHRLPDVRGRRDPPRAQGAQAEGEGEEGRRPPGQEPAPGARGDGRREGRHRR